MSETKKITSLYVVTDSENHYDQIGDIDGGMFDEVWLKNYLEKYGSANLIEKLSNMNYQIIDTVRKINQEKDNGQASVTTF